MSTPHSAGLVVRLASAADAPAVADLSGQLGHPITREEAGSRLEVMGRDPRHAVFLAELGGAGVVGWVHVQERPTIQAGLRAEVTALVVAEQYRRHGAGRLLMRRAEEWAREHRCEGVMLRSNVVRSEAHAFYESIGYRTIKSQKAFLKEF
jgi:GNAT superfamily N-acetyltransferase